VGAAAKGTRWIYHCAMFWVSGIGTTHRSDLRGSGCCRERDTLDLVQQQAHAQMQLLVEAQLDARQVLLSFTNLVEDQAEVFYGMPIPAQCVFCYDNTS
jgi:hypothetical protein